MRSVVCNAQNRMAKEMCGIAKRCNGQASPRSDWRGQSGECGALTRSAMELTSIEMQRKCEETGCMAQAQLSRAMRGIGVELRNYALELKCGERQRKCSELRCSGNAEMG